MKTFLYLFIASFFSLTTQSQICGCTDVQAANYNPEAVVNNGTCEYKKTKISFDVIAKLPKELSESSGLVFYENGFWTHNDDTDTILYCLDSVSGAIKRKVKLDNVENIDWEEIAQDNDFFYVGDFGNNYKGNRTDLKIIKIDKESVRNGKPKTDVINFAYVNQTNFESSKANKTDFDCESMVLSKDSIYLFSKQWLTNQTTVYSLSKNPGNYKVTPSKSFNVKGLITGATYLEDKRILVLCGYHKMGAPFLFLFYDFIGTDFFSGNKRYIRLSKRFLQLEGITSTNGFDYYMTCENLVLRPIINSPARLMHVNLSTYLKSYLDKLEQ